MIIRFRTTISVFTAAVMLIMPSMLVAQSVDELQLLNIAGSESLIEEAKRLLARGISPNVPNHRGRTAVHQAADGGAVEMLKILLKGGGKPGIADGEGNTPLHHAADISASNWHVHDAAGTLLLKYGADPNSLNRRRESPLHLAVRNYVKGGFTPTSGIESLLRAGATPNQRDSNGRTPLHISCGAHGSHSCWPLVPNPT